jgi:hypothetical protein
MDYEIIEHCKSIINDKSLDLLQEYFNDLIQTKSDHTPDWPFIFQKVYLHACLRSNEEIAEWMKTQIYPIMDPIQQIALRHTFTYGKYLLRKK